MSAAPLLRADLVVVEQTYRGEQSFIVKDPKSHKYFRFRPVEIRVMQSLDGVRTCAESAAALVEDGIGVSAGAVEKFATKLKAMGLLERTLGERSVLLMERLRAQRRSRLGGNGLVRGDLFRLRWSVADPDNFMDRTIPYLRFFFTRGFIIASLALFAIYFLVLAARWTEFTTALADLYLFRLGAAELAVFWLTSAVIIAIHELGHGYTCKYFGGQVHEIGAMLLYFELAFFCNVNDAWTFPDLKARLWVTAAGSWIQLVMAGIASIVWWSATPGSLVSEIALAAVIVGGATTVLMNANPLIPLDGYYALSDYLEVANLRQRAFAHLKWLLKSKVLHLDIPQPAADERERRIFLVYGLLASVYIGSIFLMVAAMLYGWLDRVFGALGIAFFATLLWLAMRGAIREWGSAAGLAWRGRRASWRGWSFRRRLGIGLALIALLGAVIPRPLTVVGPFVATPARSVPLTSPDSGVVQRVYARQGTQVSAGMPLMEIRDFYLERNELVAGRRSDSLAARVAAARAAGRSAEVARLEAERAVEEARLAGFRADHENLTVRAVASGTVLTPRPEDLAGRWVDRGQPLILLGLPDSLEVRVALTGPGSTLVRPGQPIRIFFHAGGRRVIGRVGGVAAASTGNSGAVEARVALPVGPDVRAGMTGEGSVTLRQSNVWGSLWWSLRRHIRSDILL
ncbi:MAG TPA: HlyD family efflux transporter periplasmic adaptor subunit [Gemmatimonadales bacterium]